MLKKVVLIVLMLSDCKAGYSCISAKFTATELSILSPMFAAVKDWLGVKFPS